MRAVISFLLLLFFRSFCESTTFNTTVFNHNNKTYQYVIELDRDRHVSNVCYCYIWAFEQVVSLNTERKAADNLRLKFR